MLATARPQFERMEQKYLLLTSTQFVGLDKGLMKRAPAQTEIKILDGAGRPGDLLANLRAAIAGYGDLQNGWNGDDSRTPTRAAIAAAEAFLLSIPPGMPFPKTMLTSIGATEFFWDMPTGAYADMSFDPGGIGSLFTRSPTGEEFFADDLTPDFARLPDVGALYTLLAPHLMQQAAA
jgi:hypothetical protein